MINSNVLILSFFEGILMQQVILSKLFIEVKLPHF